MLTDTEAQLLADAVLLRYDEQPGRDLWFAADGGTLCEGLVKRRYLDQRRHGNDCVYRLTDEAMTAQLTGSHQNPN
jgi:hypothetical protein